MAKSYFSLRSSVTVTLEMKASTSPESIRTKFCAQSAALISTLQAEDVGDQVGEVDLGADDRGLSSVA